MFGVTTSWRNSQLFLNIPRNYPINIPLFVLEVLKPPQKPVSLEEERKYLCEEESNGSVVEDGKLKRERRVKKNIPEETRKQKKRGRAESRQRFTLDLNGISRPWGRMKNGSKRKKETGGDQRSRTNKEGGRGRKRNKEGILALSGPSQNLLEISYDDKSHLASFFLRRKLKLNDYVRAQESWLRFIVWGRRERPEEIFCADSDPDNASRRQENKESWRQLFSVIITIFEPFDCNRLTEKMCLLPDGQVNMQQWENVAPGPLFVLPSLEALCPNLIRNIDIDMIGISSSSQPELWYSEDSQSFQTSRSLDRENRDSWLNFTLTCKIKGKSLEEKIKRGGGNLYLKDKDDSPPIRHKKQMVSWSIYDNLHHLDDKLMIIDPDESESSRDYDVRVEGDPDNLVRLNSVSRFFLKKENCVGETRDLSPSLSASCTVITPSIMFDKRDIIAHNQIVNFSVVFTDTSLSPEDQKREVWYNVTLLKDYNSIGTPDLINCNSSTEKNLIAFDGRIDQIESILAGINISYSRLIHTYARLAQFGRHDTANEERFWLFDHSQNKGVAITPRSGILYINEPDLLEESLDDGSLHILINWANENEINVFLHRSENVTLCDLEPPNPSYLKAGDRLPTSCAIHSYQSKCEKACGLGSKSGGCLWRKGKVSSYMSEHFATCSPDLSTCPDGDCDELEMLNSKICPQDCTDLEFLKGKSLEPNEPRENGGIAKGIKRGFGVCSCDDYCQCFGADQDVPTQKPHLPKKEKLPVRSNGYESEVCGPSCQIGLSVAIFITLFVISVVLCRKRKNCGNKFKDSEIGRAHYPSEYVNNHSTSYPSGASHGEAHAVALHAVHNFHHNSPRIHNSTSNNHQFMTNLPLENIQVDQKWEFPRHKLTMEQTLGEGEFGKVVKARAHCIAGHSGYTTVAVKMLKSNSSLAELSDLLSEYDLLKEVAHPNVIRLIGACTRKGGPVYLIMEYCKYGSLRSYLRQSRHFELESMVGSAPIEESPGDFKVTPKELQSFAWQICKGMAYLSNMKLVHRDLAARNVLLAKGKTCKISDFGLTRDIYEGDLYFKRSKGRVPVKWMAIESLVDHVYTSKSDVWGFGVLLWELVTLGSSPYPGVTPESLFSLLKSGHRMERPEHCSVELYQVMRRCWLESPTHRPTFAELTQIFERMIESGIEYLELKSLIVTNRTYFDETAISPDSESAPNPLVRIEGFTPKCNNREDEGTTVTQDEIPTDQDAYLVARSCLNINPPLIRRESSEPLLTPSKEVSVTTTNSSSHQNMAGTHLHAHNPAYSPTDEEGPPILIPIPPPLKYSTLINGPDEEEEASGRGEDNQEYCRSEGDSESGRATGDSGYLTEEGRRTRDHMAPKSIENPLGSITISHGSSSSLRPHEIEDEQDTSEDCEERQELLRDSNTHSGLLTPSPSMGSRIPNTSASESRRKTFPSSPSSSSSVSPLEGMRNSHQRPRRNPVVV